jgi:hypothetical protein
MCGPCRDVISRTVGAMVGFAYLMPDCWLEVSFHPEGPATGQLNLAFPWFSSIPEQMLTWYPNSHCHPLFLLLYHLGAGYLRAVNDSHKKQRLLP